MRTIPIENLYPHPQNPRVDIGDTAELAESIKAKGVLQNLTVVRNEDDATKYTVIIGHRRMAAAMEAGLETLPCNVVKMSPAEQMETMLMENMQRSDLTPYEETQGFQMMMHLGTTKTRIAEKTGFSQTTINHRLKLLDLDQELLQSTQVSMSNLIALEQIEEPEKKNEILQKYGGRSNFESIVEQEAKEITKQKNRNALIAQAAERGIGTIDSYMAGIRYICTLNCMDKPDLARILEENNVDDTKELVIYKSSYDISIYERVNHEDEAEDDPEETPAEKAERERKEKFRNAERKLRELHDSAHQNRLTFMTELFTSGKEISAESMLTLVAQMTILNGDIEINGIEDIGPWFIENFSDLRAESDEDPFEFRNDHGGKDFEDFCDARFLEADPAKLMLATIITNYDQLTTMDWGRDAHGTATTDYCSCIYDHDAGRVATAIYTMLKANGYRADDWEDALMNGTHPAYIDPADLISEKSE
ncbi:MAG: ParB/RepB/Spo0J family partition protein [Eubacteriaceae bacterium]|nr:ParB/RepB/Spo0J family partition protein [Eubacteriaceae bacterium]